MSSIRVDFYLLDSDQPEALRLVACRLLEKAYALGRQVYVLCDNQQEAEILDELLWTFKEESFIPHNLQGEGPEPPPPIQIGYAREPRGFNDVLFNLSKDVPAYFGKFKRVIEIVLQCEQAKEQSRNHYKEYRSKGCQLFTHPIESLSAEKG
jgi:DNA polymerase-3 subunit chi